MHEISGTLVLNVYPFSAFFVLKCKFGPFSKRVGEICIVLCFLGYLMVPGAGAPGSLAPPKGNPAAIHDLKQGRHHIFGLEAVSEKQLMTPVCRT